jgi:hypothetical protein
MQATLKGGLLLEIDELPFFTSQQQRHFSILKLCDYGRATPDEAKYNGITYSRLLDLSPFHFDSAGSSIDG